MARWAALACTLVATASAAEPPCKPTATVRGDGDVTEQTAALLRARGIEVLAPSGDPAFVGNCRRVAAELTWIGGQIMVAVVDADGRRAQRLAEDPEAAATVIESWARGDLLDPLLAARGVIEVGTRLDVGATTVAPTRPRYLVAAGADVGVSGDGAVWSGARVQACGRIGAWCIGGLARFALDLEQTGDTAELETARHAMGLTATAERPIRRGRFVLSPGAGIGLAAVTASLAAEDEVEQASAFHVRGALAAALAIAGAWSLRVDLAAEYAPLARERLGEADGVDRQLAASPKLQTWLGVVIAYGGP